MNILYHGSIEPNIKILEPRKRYTPRELGENVPPAIYASDEPAYCVAHAIPWESGEGFDLTFDEVGKVKFTAPKNYKDRLNQKIYIYEVPKEKFELLAGVSPKGHNYWSKYPVEVISVSMFRNVFEALDSYGGGIKYI